MIEEARKMSEAAPSEDEIQQAFNEGYTAALYDNDITEIAYHYGYETQRE